MRRWFSPSTNHAATRRRTCVPAAPVRAGAEAGPLKSPTPVRRRGYNTNPAQILALRASRTALLCPATEADLAPSAEPHPHPGKADRANQAPRHPF
jgi:hypothetical protein